MVSSLALLLVSSLISTARCEIGGIHASDDLLSFKSRPDLRPPKFHVETLQPDKVAPGYFFTAPYAHSDLRGDGIWAACQAGPAIYDGEGELVWTGGCQYGTVYDFKVSDCDIEGGCLSFNIRELKWPDGSRHGTGVILDNTYQIDTRILVDNNFDLHEFHVLPGGKTVLFVNNQIRAHSFENLGFKEDEFLRWTTLYEVDIATGDVLWKWDTPDHLPLNQSTFHPPEGPGEKPRERAWDYDHANSIDKDQDGNYYASYRHTNCLIKISGKDGHIMWQLGGIDSDFDMTDLHFSRQHHARLIESTKDHTILSIFDNASGEYGKNDNEPPSNEMSRSIIVKANHPRGKPTTAEMLREYTRPDGELTELRGSTQVLDNGNVLSSWSKGGYQSEHTENGELVQESGFDSERYSTYRSYKYEFAGEPHEPPHAVAETFGASSSSLTTIVYVSWNGATEVKSWNFFAISKETGQSSFLGNGPKQGFETMWMYEGYAENVWVEGLDKEGKVLGRTDKVTVSAPTDWFKSGFSKFDKIPSQSGKNSGSLKNGDWRKELKGQLARDVDIPVIVLALIPLGALAVWIRPRFCAPLLRTTRRHLDGYRGFSKHETSAA